MYLSELTNRHIVYQHTHLSPWYERRTGAALERIGKMQVMAERIQKGMSIIEWMLGS